MAGYTPVFSSVFTGTLCGKYPDTAAWLFILALADKNGHLDATPAYIAGVTGMPESDLIECIGRFMQPDPYSRSTEYEGRRLIPLDPARPWGWKVVNHSKYREKARQQSRDARRVDSGENAARMQEKRRPPLTPADPPSNTNTNINIKKKDIGTAFKKPSVADVSAYAQELGSTVCPQTFVDYYESNGWKVGKNAMRDWKATLRRWSKDEKPNGTARPAVLESAAERRARELREYSERAEGGASLDPVAGDARGQVFEGVWEHPE